MASRWSRDHLSQPAAPLHYPVTVHICLPEPGRGYNDMVQYPDMVTTRKQIEARFQVLIEPDTEGEMITVKAVTKDGARNAIKALQETLKCKPGDRNTIWQQRVLVTPPSSGKESVKIQPHKRNDTKESRPVAIPVELLVPVDPEIISRQQLKYVDGLQQDLEHIAARLRAVPNAMRMRVVFGRFLMKEWRKDIALYDFSDFERLATRAGPRGTTRLDSMIGGKYVANMLKAFLKSLTPDEEPLLAHSLVVVTDALELESTIGYVQGKGAATTGHAYEYSLGPIKAAHRGKRHRSLEIMTSCPENHYDWSLEIKSLVDEQDSSQAIPFTDKDLGRNVRFLDAVSPHDFPKITIFKDFIQQHDIRTVLGKSTWTYEISLQYQVEVISYYGITAGNAPQIPTHIGTGLALYGCEWDEHMGHADVSVSPRDWESFAKRFLVDPLSHLSKNDKEKEDPELYQDFLDQIRQLQGMLDSATSDSDSTQETHPTRQ